MRGSVPDNRSHTPVTQSTFKRDLTKKVKNNPRYWDFFFFFRLKDEKKGLSVSDAAVKTKTEHCLLLKEDI